MAKNQKFSSLCGCKRNDEYAGPYCDGSHNDIDWWLNKILLNGVDAIIIYPCLITNIIINSKSFEQQDAFEIREDDWGSLL